jgi:hypothetical protein
MMTKTTKKILSFTVIFSTIISIAFSTITTNAQTPSFNPNYILSDSTFSSKRAFPTQESVQQFLTQVRSPLANYSVQSKPASYWIFAAANGTTNTYMGIRPNLNPGLLLAMLEKEQSLLSRTNYNTYSDKEVRLKWAMGMGCPDTSACNDDYAGFVNQINWGAFQLQYNYEKSTIRNGGQYKVGNNIKTMDGYDVNLSNAATASVYRYTPHVYWGNYNLWKIITANGWGTSTDKYAYAEIDKANGRSNKSPTIQNYPTQSKQTEIESTSLLNMPSDVYKQQQNIPTGNIKTLNWPTLNQAQKPATQSTSNSNQRYSLQGFDCKDLKNRKWNYGETSEDVRNLQVCMQSAGKFVWKYGATGYFGDATKSALIAWRGWF